MSNKIVFLVCLFCVSLVYAADNEVFQLAVNPQGEFIASVSNRKMLEQVINSSVQKKEAVFQRKFEEQKKVELLRKDLDWMHDLFSLLSEQDQKGCNFEVREYVKNVSEKKTLYSEFYLGSLEAAKNKLKKKIKKTLAKAYEYEPLVTNYKPEMQNKDRQIDQLKDRLQTSFVVDKTMVKRLGFLAIFAGLVIWMIHCLYRNKCNQC